MSGCFHLSDERATGSRLSEEGSSECKEQGAKCKDGDGFFHGE